MTAPRRVAIYVRVSTRDQRLLQQFREVRHMVERRGWTVARVYRERRSAKAGAHRPEWERLRKDAARRRFGAVAVWSIDRMGRSTLDVLNAVQGFDERGVKLLIVKQRVDTSTPMGKLVLTVLAAIAEMERELIAERTRAGMAYAKSQGRHVGRVAFLVPRDAIESVLRGEKSAAQVGRELGISASTIRGRVRAAKRAGVEGDTAGQTADQQERSNADGQKSTTWDPAEHLTCMEHAPLVGGPYWKCPTCTRVFRKAQIDLRDVYEEHRVRCVVTVPIGQQEGLT